MGHEPGVPLHDDTAVITVINELLHRVKSLEDKATTERDRADAARVNLDRVQRRLVELGEKLTTVQARLDLVDSQVRGFESRRQQEISVAVANIVDSAHGEVTQIRRVLRDEVGSVFAIVDYVPPDGADVGAAVALVAP